MTQVTTLREVREDATSRTSPARMRPHIKGTSRRCRSNSCIFAYIESSPHGRRSAIAARREHPGAGQTRSVQGPRQDHHEGLLIHFAARTSRREVPCIGQEVQRALRPNHSHRYAESRCVCGRTSSRRRRRLSRCGSTKSSVTVRDMIHSICTILQIPIAKFNPLISLQSFPAARSSTSRVR